MEILRTTECVIAINLNSSSANDANITGGRMNDVTAGVNWYLNPRTKFQFNYIHAFLDSPTFNSPLIGNSNADIFAFRGQIDFQLARPASPADIRV